MEIFQIAALGIIAVIISVIVKKYKPEMALQIAIAVSVIIFILMIGKLNTVFDLLNDITKKASIDLVYFTVILKIIAIAYITEFSSEVCRDAGESTIALKVEFAGKVLILVLAAPIVYALLDLVVKIIP